MGLRNAGAGIALLDGWHARGDLAFAPDPHADLPDFRRQNMDLYIAPSDAGYWEGAIRADDDPLRPGLLTALAERQPFTIELLYGDQDGGQRTISRFHVLPDADKVGIARPLSTGT